MQKWEYLTAYLAGGLDFPNEVERAEELAWVSKSITQQLNDHAEQGWEIRDLHWLSERELLVTFQRPFAQNHEGTMDDNYT